MRCLQSCAEDAAFSAFGLGFPSYLKQTRAMHLDEHSTQILILKSVQIIHEKQFRRFKTVHLMSHGRRTSKI